MEIVVCIKQVPGTTDVDVDEETGVLKRSGVDSRMNPYDLYALETAVKLKESKNAKVNVITMGPPQAEEVLRESYMVGADMGMLLSDMKFAGADVLSTAYTLSQGIKKFGSPDLIICGKQTTDGDTAQVGPEIAEFLNIPHIAYVTKIVEIKDDSMIVEMDMMHSVEVAEIAFPCLITVEKGIYMPRLPSFKKKLATQDREILTCCLDDFKDQDEKNYGLNGSPTQVLRIFPPEEKADKETWTGTGNELADRMLDRLAEEKFI